MHEVDALATAARGPREGALAGRGLLDPALQRLLPGRPQPAAQRRHLRAHAAAHRSARLLRADRGSERIARARWRRRSRPCTGPDPARRPETSRARSGRRARRRHRRCLRRAALTLSQRLADRRVLAFPDLRARAHQVGIAAHLDHDVLGRARAGARHVEATGRNGGEAEFAAQDVVDDVVVRVVELEPAGAAGAVMGAKCQMKQFMCQHKDQFVVLQPRGEAGIGDHPAGGEDAHGRDAPVEIDAHRGGQSRKMRQRHRDHAQSVLDPLERGAVGIAVGRAAAATLIASSPCATPRASPCRRRARPIARPDRSAASAGSRSAGCAGSARPRAASPRRAARPRHSAGSNSG